MNINFGINVPLARQCGLIVLDILLLYMPSATVYLLSTSVVQTPYSFSTTSYYCCTLVCTGLNPVSDA